MTHRESILAMAEQLIAEAVQLVYPLCGEQVTVGVLQQMAEEQARYATLGRLILERPPTAARH